MGSKIEVEVELKSGVEKIWNSIRDSITVFPKAMPHMYQAIQVLEGDGKSVGSVREVHYPQGLSDISSIKEKIELVEEEKKKLSYIVIEGDVLKYYSPFKGNISVIEKGDGSTVQWSCEFDKTSEELPNPDLIKDFAIKTFNDLDAFLLAN